MRAADLAELVRLPAALTVPGDAWAGAASVAGGRSWAAPVSSVLLYWGGMALNDWSDREVDAVERPERPVPSGRVPAAAALGVATGLLGAGVAASAVVGGRPALRVSVPLAALVVTYDTVAKDAVVGPLVMGSTRGLDVLLGAAAAPGGALAPAAAMTAHTVGVTALSRGEVHGTSPSVARAVVATTCAVAAAGIAAAALDRGGRARDRVAAAALHGAYAAVVVRAQARAVTSPDAGTVRSATGIGIGGLPLLQAAWLAQRGRPLLGAAVAAAGPLLRRATRKVSAT
ncbi:SCO3242 family prenyltransferase [Nocardioides sp. TF02-7]|uniref:SCO3242 family prenyltransferase n=1 Tax=Nocardioides sp. TF02-7 TaxID=2917724 RepID=UPI001F0687D9|nr:UbiA family prenyltransferase [Nocardioides sp. TF02-7]UMG92418.1 UbiA family prenyltransferase [Nocardioides sp. TF02-7]